MTLIGALVAENELGLVPGLHELDLDSFHDRFAKIAVFASS